MNLKLLVSKGDRATLTPLEQRIATHLGKERTATYPPDHRIRFRGGRDLLTNNIWGAGGELAFARLVNVYPDLTTHWRIGGGDCQLRTGEWVDVKTTSWVETPLLIVNIEKSPRDVDLYALMSCKYPHYQFVGWAPTIDVFASLRDVGHGASHVLRPDELHEDLVTLEEEVPR